MQEEWKFIQGFGGRYEVSNYGFVRSYLQKGTNKMMSEPQRGIAGTLEPSGYIALTLSAGNKKRTIRAHRLVLEAFIGGCPNGMECCHKDNNKSNNKLSNLEWNTHRANIMEYGGHVAIGAKGEQALNSKLTNDDVRVIRERAISGETHAQIAKDFPVQRRNVTRIVNRRRWAHVI
jgi:hypothetical protein